MRGIHDRSHGRGSERAAKLLQCVEGGIAVGFAIGGQVAQPVGDGVCRRKALRNGDEHIDQSERPGRSTDGHNCVQDNCRKLAEGAERERALRPEHIKDTPAKRSKDGTDEATGQQQAAGTELILPIHHLAIVRQQVAQAQDNGLQQHNVYDAGRKRPAAKDIDMDKGIGTSLRQNSECGSKNNTGQQQA